MSRSSNDKVPMLLVRTFGTFRWEDAAMVGADEIKRRVEAVLNGTAECIPGDQVFAEMRARFG